MAHNRNISGITPFKNWEISWIIYRFLVVIRINLKRLQAQYIEGPLQFRDCLLRIMGSSKGYPDETVRIRLDKPSYSIIASKSISMKNTVEIRSVYTCRIQNADVVVNFIRYRYVAPSSSVGVKIKYWCLHS